MKKKALPSILLALVLVLTTASSVFALFTNGGFEGGDFTGWTETTFLNPGLGGSPPFVEANINRNPGGSNTNAVLGPFAALSQTDANSGNNLAFPAYGSYTGRVNDGTTGQNSTTIYQETVVGAGDADPVDGNYHVRFVYAAAMEDPGHIPAEQPYFFVLVKNVTQGTTLYEKMSYANEPGVPWVDQGNGWVWLDWTLVDIDGGDGSIALGDTLSLEVIAAACALGGHGGYAYVDEFGAFIPGPTIDASGPAYAAPGTDIVYTYNYFNGAAADVPSTVTINEPTGLDFTTAPGCTVNASDVVCDLGTVTAGTGGSLSVTGAVTGVYNSTINHGDYNIAATGYPTVTGPVVNTSVTYTYFDTSSVWTSALDQSHGWNVSTYERTVGDVDGDGDDDAVGFGYDGVYVALSDGSSFGANAVRWTPALGRTHGWRADRYPRMLADVNGDGMQDAAGFGIDGIYVALSDGSGFAANATRWSTAFDYNHGWRVDMYPRTFADVDGDGDDDAVGFGVDGIYVALSDGSSFASTPTKWSTAFSYNGGWRVNMHPRMFADVDGDGDDDAVGFGIDGIYVALSNGSSIENNPTKWSTDFSYNKGWQVDMYPRTFADIDGDGDADAVGFGQDGVYVVRSDGSGFGSITRWTKGFDYNSGWRVSDHARVLGDVTGDGAADAVGFGLDGIYIGIAK